MIDKKLIAVVVDEIPPDALPDEQDTLVQVEAVSDALQRLGYRTRTVSLTPDFNESRGRIQRLDPFLVFNCAESFGGRNSLLHVVPLLFQEIGYPFTGSDTEALYTTTNKVLAKKIMRLSGMHTPRWQMLHDVKAEGCRLNPPYIVKPALEDASTGITDASVVFVDGQDMDSMVPQPALPHAPYFLEQFIDGREFNISLLAGTGKPEILPVAEIDFSHFPPGKPRIVGYGAKWDTESFDYTHTTRSFDFAKKEKPLLDALTTLAGTCWTLFGLNGYARVDIRVDSNNTPWVIEINANPCIAPDSGFVAAAFVAGYTYEGIISRIIDDAYTRRRMCDDGVFS